MANLNLTPRSKNVLNALGDAVYSTPVKKKKSREDRALVVRPGDPLGGINFDPAMLNLQIKRDGKGMPLPLNQQPIGNMKIDGFMPIIIEMHRNVDMRAMTGIDQPALALSH